MLADMSIHGHSIAFEEAASEIIALAVEDAQVAVPSVLGDTEEEVDCIILQEGWGASGYYGREILPVAVEAFPEGTQMYIGHPEGVQMPIQNSAGVLAGAARFVPNDPEAGGKATLRAPIIIFPDQQGFVKPRARRGAAALSIRAPFNYRDGVADGRSGRIVTGFRGPALSVDIVSRAGAGGKFGRFKESADFLLHEEKEGSEMPLTKEETEAIAAESAKAVATVLAEPLAGIATALTTLGTAREQAAPVLSARALAEKVDGSKLHKEAKARLWLAIEAAEPANVTEQFVTDLIATEAERVKEAVEIAKESFKGGDFILENPENNDGKSDVSAWAAKRPNGGK